MLVRKMTGKQGGHVYDCKLEVDASEFVSRGKLLQKVNRILELGRDAWDAEQAATAVQANELSNRYGPGLDAIASALRQSTATLEMATNALDALARWG